MIKKLTPILLFCLAGASISGFIFADDMIDLRAIVFSWRDARQMKQWDNYRSFYSSQFKSGAYDYTSWMDDVKNQFQSPDSLSVNISEPDIEYQGDRAVAKFTDKVESGNLSILGKKKLIFGRTANNWQIVSEGWEKMAGFISYMKADSHQTGENSSQRVTVQFIQFNYEENKPEKIFIGFDRYCIPELIPLEGSNPRVALDIGNTYLADTNGTFFMNGYLIKQIRTYYHRNTEILRIVLDLNPNEDFNINPTFYQSDNRYCLEVLSQRSESVESSGGHSAGATEDDAHPERQVVRSSAASSEENQENEPDPTIPDEGSISDEPLKQVIVNVDRGRVRQSPSLQAKILFILKKNDVVTILDSTDDWYAIQLDDDRKGWSHKSLFREP